ncbi:hypothetical protein [Clostridium sp. UBA6640]|uniref:hypothetical protein n=1 Tax=Clostridium sp. UBA6640 TaxID=1946370 RepID=UPI0025BEB493|nr:hypothetical protein [Clostridium sp. UBA6640]
MKHLFDESLTTTYVATSASCGTQCAASCSYGCDRTCKGHCDWNCADRCMAGPGMS